MCMVGQCGMAVRLGEQQECPGCGMYNKSGLTLPEECTWCHGTGEIDFGFELPEELAGTSSPLAKHVKVNNKD